MRRGRRQRRGARRCNLDRHRPGLGVPRRAVRPGLRQCRAGAERARNRGSTIGHSHGPTAEPRTRPHVVPQRTAKTTGRLPTHMRRRLLGNGEPNVNIRARTRPARRRTGWLAAIGCKGWCLRLNFRRPREACNGDTKTPCHPRPRPRLCRGRSCRGPISRLAPVFDEFDPTVQQAPFSDSDCRTMGPREQVYGLTPCDLPEDDTQFFDRKHCGWVECGNSK